MMWRHKRKLKCKNIVSWICRAGVLTDMVVRQRSRRTAQLTKLEVHHDNNNETKHVVPCGRDVR